MVKLPFHVDSPLAMGFSTLALSLVVLFLLWAYGRDILVGKVLRWYFQRRFSSLGSEKANTVARRFLLFLTVVFGAVAVSGLILGSGLIENGDEPPALTLEEFLKNHDRSSNHTARMNV